MMMAVSDALHAFFACASQLTRLPDYGDCNGVFQGLLTGKCSRCSRLHHACVPLVHAQLIPLLNAAHLARVAHARLGEADDGKQEARADFDAANTQLHKGLKKYNTNASSMTGDEHTPRKRKAGAAFGGSMCGADSIVPEIQKARKSLNALVEIGREVGYLCFSCASIADRLRRSFASKAVTLVPSTGLPKA